MKKITMRGVTVALFLLCGCMIWNERDSETPQLPATAFVEKAERFSFDPKQLPESSGLLAIHGEKNRFLTHGDSFSPSKLYLFRCAERTIDNYVELSVKGACQNDWEDVSWGDDGQLYLADIGDNLRIRTEKRIYRIDWQKTVASNIAAIEQHWWVCCRKDGKTVYADTEAFFVYEGDFYLITKNSGEALIFKADPSQGERLEAREVARFHAFDKITAADVRDDGKRLAILSYNYLYILDLSAGVDDLQNKILKLFTLDCGQCEGVCFTVDGGLALINEDGEFYRLSTEEIP